MNNIYDYINENNLIYGITNGEKICDTIIEETPFVNVLPEVRVNPNLTMENVKSILVIGMGYKKTLVGEKSNLLTGKISNGAIGEDYHVIIKKHLIEIGNIIRKTHENLEYKAFVDTGPLNERSLAVKAGLGYIGKNKAVINEVLGGYFFIGYLLLNINIEKIKKRKYKTLSCGSCDKCIKLCPTNAINLKGFNYKLCISYLTQCKNLDKNEEKLIGNNIYGCDICQDVCPHNAKVAGEICENIVARPELDQIINMDKEGFNKNFKNTAAGWRGIKVIKRNGEIGKRNLEGGTKGEL